MGDALDFRAGREPSIKNCPSTPYSLVSSTSHEEWLAPQYVGTEVATRMMLEASKTSSTWP